MLASGLSVKAEASGFLAYSRTSIFSPKGVLFIYLINKRYALGRG